MIREAATDELLALARRQQLPLVTRTLAVADVVRGWVLDNEAGSLLGLALFASMPAPYADPAGWWLTQAWTAPDVRGMHYGVPLIRAGLVELDADGISPLLFRQPDPSRPLVGAWNYRADPRPWHYLGNEARHLLQLYSADPLDLAWDPSTAPA